MVQMERRPPWQRASALVFVDDTEQPELHPDDAHHLGRVLRLRSGNEVCVTDGTGRWAITHFDGVGAVSPSGEHGVAVLPPVPVTVGVALVKGTKPDLVVQKLTEIGVDRIVLFDAERSVVRWDEAKRRRNIDRLVRVSRSASCQSRRVHPPVVHFAELADLLGEGAVVADFGGRPITEEDTAVLVGPEGGWVEGEYGTAERVDLGPNVLRAETAAIVAAVRLTSSRSDHSA